MITTISTFTYRLRIFIFVAIGFCGVMPYANAIEIPAPSDVRDLPNVQFTIKASPPQCVLLTVDNCVDAINDKHNWDVAELTTIKPEYNAYRAAELLGALRLSLHRLRKNPSG